MRLAANNELFPTLDNKNRKYYQFKQAKEDFIYHLISKFNIIKQYSATLREIGHRRISQKMFQDQETSANLMLSWNITNNIPDKSYSYSYVYENFNQSSAKVKVIDLCSEDQSVQEEDNAVQKEVEVGTKMLKSAEMNSQFIATK